MFNYQVYIDVARSSDWIDIDVISVIVSADSSEEAHKKAQENVEDGTYDNLIGYHESYVWDVTEDDKVEGEIA